MRPLTADGTPATLTLPEQIVQAHQLYTKKSPLDLADNSEANQVHWQNNYQYSILRYNQLLAVLFASNTLDEFVQASTSDFDNIAPFLESLINSGIINVSQDGNITQLAYFKPPFPQTADQVSNITPLKELNQFPCDQASRTRRHQLLNDRYPHATKVRVGIVGDDDLLSIELATDQRFETLVLEKDPRIVELIAKHTQQQCTLITRDVVDINADDINQEEKVQTFITDPPYTLDGSLAFIKAGLSIMQNNREQKEFYVVLNPTMMGRKIEGLLRILALAGITLTYIVENFSQYKLPTQFRERTRANMFLANHGISEAALQYSSSSNLYVFTTRGDNPAHDLTEHIDVSKLYDHYED